MFVTYVHEHIFAERPKRLAEVYVAVTCHINHLWRWYNIFTLQHVTNSVIYSK